MSAFIRLGAFQQDNPDQHASSGSLCNTLTKVCLFLAWDQSLTSNKIKELEAFLYFTKDCYHAEPSKSTPGVWLKPEEINGWGLTMSHTSQNRLYRLKVY